MELKEYIEDVLTVLKKNRELELLMSNLAEDSALATIKNTVLDIEKRVVKDRLIELTERYLGKVDFTEKKEKDKKKRFSFVRIIGATPTIDTTPVTPKLTRAERREEMIREKEAKKAAREKEKQIRAEEKRIQRKQKVEAELKSLNEEQNG